MDKYLSQRLYKNIGDSGQDKLSKANVTIIGIGALGTVCSELLARAGIRKLTLIDRDVVESQNLQRQVLFDEGDLGIQKAKAAEKKLKKINSAVKISAKCVDFNYKNADIVGKPDLVIAATDNMESRFVLNDYCLKNKIPLIYGGAVSDTGSLYVIHNNGPCMRCIFRGASDETCDNSGILNACSSIMGSMMAKEAIRLIVEGEYEKELIYFKVWENEISKIKVTKNKNCMACDGNYEYLDGKIKTKMVSLCGNGVYHLKGRRVSLPEIYKKLARYGEIKKHKGVLVFRNITLFDDGRAIIKAKSEPEARKSYSTYIGN